LLELRKTLQWNRQIKRCLPRKGDIQQKLEILGLLRLKESSRAARGQVERHFAQKGDVQ